MVMQDWTLFILVALVGWNIIDLWNIKLKLKEIERRVEEDGE